jgi:flagellar hook protein FlgE
MSLLSALMASVSGMQAQANSLSTISDNIANADTTGYKNATTQFEDMLSSVSANNYNAGGVATVVGYNISSQGSLASTTSATDLAIQGNGFFVVQNSSGANLLTRAGSFTQNSSGTLVNAAGFTLMGEPYTAGASNISDVNQLVPVTINPVAVVANPTTSGTLVANLDSTAAVVTPTLGPPEVDLPSANTADSTYTNETSITAYDDLGKPVNLNVYFTNTGAGTWEVDVYNAADATSGGFPYATTTGGVTTNDTPLASENLTFDSTTGALTSATQTGAVTGTTAGAAITNYGTLAMTVPNGQTLNLDISSMSQLASSFAISNNTVNGNAAATFQNVSIATDGTLSEVYSNGTTVPVYTIPLATVASVDSLTPLAGDAYQANEQSGSLVIDKANTGGMGSINSDELESSTVDLATELTNMVVAQNAYSANSKAFQVGSDLLQELSNLIK